MKTAGSLLAAAASVALCAPALAAGFDAEAFETFVSARVGDGAPVYWVSEGTIKSYPDGALLFRMTGFDTATSNRPDAERALVQQFNRKIYFYADGETGDVLTEWNDAPVAPIAYPYQFISYELKGDTVETFIEQGPAGRVQRFGPSSAMTARRLGDTLVVSAPVFLDLEIPNTDRRIDAYEHYDFFLQPDGAVDEPHQLSWVRYGDLPPWAAEASPTGKAIYHLVTWRVENWSDVPERLRRHVDANYPLWQAPPASLDEIRALQAPDAEAGKGF